MKTEFRTATRLGPLSRRAPWISGGLIASLALTLAAGVVSPAAAAAQSTGNRVSTLSRVGGGGDECQDGGHHDRPKGLFQSFLGGDGDCGQGGTGPSGHIVTTEVPGSGVDVAPGGFGNDTAVCPPGQTAISGGFIAGFLTPAGSRQTTTVTPNDSWTVGFRNDTTETNGAFAYAYCSS